MLDTEIIDLYFSRNEQALAETDKKYGAYCLHIAYNVLRSDEDAAEVLNETLYKVWTTVPPKKPENLKPYVGMIARQLSCNIYNARRAEKRGGGAGEVSEELFECIPDKSLSDPCDLIALRDTMNGFLSALSERNRCIFLRRYWYTASVSEIADEYGIREGNVVMILLRIRKKLKKYLEKEGIGL